MNQLVLMLTAYLALVGQPDNLRPVADDEWQSYKVAYNKSYESQQIELLRRSVYAVNKAKVERQIVELRKANSSHTIGVTKFTDWTDEEFKRIQGTRYDPNKKSWSSQDEAYIQKLLEANGAAPLPDHFDWRKVEGRVSEVKNQYQCGSCWAFAATGALEGQEKGKVGGGQLVELSEQNLVDCVYANRSSPDGCIGGLPDDAYAYVGKFGIEDEKSYPYDEAYVKCRFSEEKVAVKAKGFVDLPTDEHKLKQLLVASGPISVGVNSKGLAEYVDGIFRSWCPQKELIDHSVLLVGYGVDPDEGHFWIVKNSWGKDWGENGYFRLIFGFNSACVKWQAALPKL